MSPLEEFIQNSEMVSLQKEKDTLLRRAETSSYLCVHLFTLLPSRLLGCLKSEGIFTYSRSSPAYQSTIHASRLPGLTRMPTPRGLMTNSSICDQELSLLTQP